MRSTLFCLVLATSVFGCKKKAADTAASGSGSGSAAPAGAFSGTLTADIIMGAAHQIDVYTPDGKPAPFAPALAAAKTKLGEPTHVDGSKYMWGVVNGDKCTYYVLEDKGGNASTPGSATVPGNDADCLAATGKAPAAGSGSDAAGSGSAAAGSGSAAAGSGSGAAGSGSAAAGSAAH